MWLIIKHGEEYYKVTINLDNVAYIEPIYETEDRGNGCIVGNTSTRSHIVFTGGESRDVKIPYDQLSTAIKEKFEMDRLDRSTLMTRISPSEVLLIA